MASDFFSNALSSIGNAASQGYNDLSKAVGDEANKVVSRTAKNVKGDFDEIADGIKKNGALGGACATFDVLTPGHATAEILDDAGVVTDPAMKQLIASGVNISMGAGIPGAGLLLQADGIAEGIDGVSKLFGGAKAQPGVPQQSTMQMPPAQSNQCPADAYKSAQRERAIEAAKMKSAEKTAYVKGFEAGERAGERKGFREGLEVGEHRATTMPVNGGWPSSGPCYGGSAEGSIRASTGDMNDLMGQMFGQYSGDDIDDKLKQIMNSGMSFEDRIFMLMTTVVSEDQDSIQGQSNDLLKQDAAAKAAYDSSTTQINALMNGPNASDPTTQAKITEMQHERDNASTNANNSRQDAFQKIQQATSKLSEMQQALSGTLNSLHDTAMSTIRNIK
jgi:hypothetical protein